MEYEVLGLKLKLTKNSVDNSVEPEQIVEFVRSHALAIKEKNPRLDDGKVATLLAMDIAEKYLSMEKDFKESVNTFSQNAADTLKLLNDGKSKQV